MCDTFPARTRKAYVYIHIHIKHQPKILKDYNIYSLLVSDIILITCIDYLSDRNLSCEVNIEGERIT